MIRPVLRETANIIVMPGSVVAAVRGNERLVAIEVEDTKTGERRRLDAAPMFIFIGSAHRARTSSPDSSPAMTAASS